MTPLIAKLAKHFSDPERFYWFDNSAVAVAKNGTIVNNSCLVDAQLPYPCCAIVYSDGVVEYSILLEQRGDCVSVAMRRWKPAIRPWRRFIYKSHNGAVVTETKEDYSDESRRRIEAAIAQIATWYTALQPGVSASKPTKVGTPAQQAKRARHGKAPLFEWHTVTIQPKQTKAEPQGGTHASPRLHDRRGHWRSLTSGKQVWVRNCKVGDASKGVIFKDYKL